MVFLQQVINGLALGGTYSLIAIGWTTVFGVVGVINWTHGEVYMIGAYVGYFLVTLAHFGLVPALAVSALVSGTLAVLIDKICYKPLRSTDAPRLAFFITALGASTFLRFSATAFWRPDARSYPKVMEFKLVKLLEINGQVVTINSLQLYIIGLTLVIMVLLQLFLTKSRMGKAMLAASQDLQTLSLMGVESERLISLTFLISGMLGGVAGVFMGVLYAINPMMGALAGLKGWAVAIMGGVGSITGSMIGGVFLGIVENLVSGFVSTGYRDAIAFTVMILVLLVKPTGLLGFKFEEKV